jgi:hypothetical protein
MINMIAYWGLMIIIFSVCWILTFLLIIIIFILLDRLLGLSLIPDKKNPPKLIILSMILAPTLISFPASYYSLGYFNFYPKQLSSDINESKESVTKINKDLIKLQKIQDDIKKLLDSPKKLTISQINEILSETIRFTNNLNEQSNRQQKLINKLREELSNEKKKTEESLTLAKETQSMTKKQLDTIKFLITEDAKTESRKSFFYGILVSFPLGIITSLIGTLLYIRFKRQIKQKVSKAVGVIESGLKNGK